MWDIARNLQLEQGFDYGALFETGCWASRIAMETLGLVGMLEFLISVHQVSHALSEKDFRAAESLLQQIQDSFEDTKKISRRYQTHAILDGPTSDALAISVIRVISVSKTCDFTPSGGKLRRQKSTALVQKVRWALYEKKEHDVMTS